MYMRKAVLLSFLTLVHAVTVFGVEKPTEEDFAIDFSSEVVGTVRFLGYASPESVRLVEKIKKAIGLDMDFVVMSAQIEKYAAAFTTHRNGKHYIVFDRNRRDWLRAEGPSLVDLRLLCHEIGHNFSYMLAGYKWPHGQYEEEFRADMFAGFALARMGFTMKQATKGMGDGPATKWHPAGLERKAMVEEGWRLGSVVNSYYPDAQVCRPGFETPELEVEYSVCRIARQCDGGKPIRRLTCKGLDGKWQWVEKN